MGTADRLASVMPSILGFSLLLISVLGILGNSIVIFALSTVKKRRVTDNLILNLAMADLLYTAVLPFWAMEKLRGGLWLYGLFLCKFISFVFLLNLYASVYFLTALSVDRFIAVVVGWKIRGPVYTGIISLVGWLFSSVMGSISFTHRSLFHPCALSNNRNASTSCSGPDEGGKCMWSFATTFQSNFFLGTKIICGFVLPLLIIILCYSSIVYKVRKVTARANTNRKSNHKIESVILIVILSFFFMWLPNNLFNTIMIFAEVRHSSWASILNGMTVIFASLNSCLNPVIYAFLKPNLRKHLIGVIRHREVSGHGLFSPRPSIRKSIFKFTDGKSTSRKTSQPNQDQEVNQQALPFM